MGIVGVKGYQNIVYSLSTYSIGVIVNFARPKKKR